MINGVVYSALNTITGKRYIGQSWGWDNRVRHHIKQALCGNNDCPCFYAAIRKYGPDVFEWSLIFTGIQTQAEMDSLEQESISLYKTHRPHGYNIREGGMGGRHSTETKWKMSLAKTGAVFSETHRANLSESLTGRTLSDECRRKMSKNRLGNKHRVGKVISEEHKQQIRAALTGRKKSPEHVENFKKSWVLRKQKAALQANLQMIPGGFLL